MALVDCMDKCSNGASGLYGRVLVFSCKDSTLVQKRKKEMISFMILVWVQSTLKNVISQSKLPKYSFWNLEYAIRVSSS